MTNANYVLNQLQNYCNASNTVVSFRPNGLVRVTDVENQWLYTADDLAARMNGAANDNARQPAPAGITLAADGYESLADVLARAFDQASNGKGQERHANALPFHKQPMQVIAGQVGTGFLLGQAIKKIQESQKLPPGRDTAELLGAINYIAGCVIFLESQHQAANDPAMDAPTPPDSNLVAVVAAMDRVGEVVEASPYCSRSGDASRPICGECQPYGHCLGI